MVQYESQILLCLHVSSPLVDIYIESSMLIIQMRIRLCVCRSCNGLYSYAESMVRAQNDIFRYAYSNRSIVNAIDGVNTNIYSTFCFNIVEAITDSRLFFCPTDMSECCVSIITQKVLCILHPHVFVSMIEAATFVSLSLIHITLSFFSAHFSSHLSYTTKIFEIK